MSESTYEQGVREAAALVEAMQERRQIVWPKDILALLDNAPPHEGFATSDAEGQWIRDTEAGVYDTNAPAPAGVTVQEAAKVLLAQPCEVMAKAFNAIDRNQGEGADNIMAAALRALSEDRT